MNGKGPKNPMHQAVNFARAGISQECGVRCREADRRALAADTSEIAQTRGDAASPLATRESRRRYSSPNLRCIDNIASIQLKLLLPPVVARHCGLFALKQDTIFHHKQVHLGPHKATV